LLLFGKAARMSAMFAQVDKRLIKLGLVMRDIERKEL
jgi:hypothetical protein